MARQEQGLVEALESFLWQDAAEPADTAGFRGQKHEDLLQSLQRAIDRQFGTALQVTIVHSLDEAGCDIGIRFPDSGVKRGVQLKSYQDVGQKCFARDTLAQIQDSRQHGLDRLYVVLCGDMKDCSQSQKVHGLLSRISRIGDDYVHAIPPERAWTLLHNPAPLKSDLAALLIPRPPQPYFAHPYPLQQNFTGRVAERRMLTEWFTTDDRPVLVLEGLGGMGKSALTWAWIHCDALSLPLPGLWVASPVPESERPEGVLWWSFYEREARFARFVDEAITYLSSGTVNPADIPSAYDRTRTLLRLLEERRVLVVLDGFERELRAYAGLNAAYQGDTLPEQAGGDHLACTDPYAGDFLRWLAGGSLRSKVLLTSRLFPRELEGLAGCRHQRLDRLHPDDAVAFFRAEGVRKGTRAEILTECEPYGYNPLALRLLAGFVVRDKRDPGDIVAARRHPVLAQLKGKEQHHILQVSYDALDSRKRSLLSRIAAFRSPVSYAPVRAVSAYKTEKGLDAALDELAERGLLLFDTQRALYDLHPIVRRYAYERLRDKSGVHTRLRDHFAAVPAPDKDEVRSLQDLNPVIELYHHTVGAGLYDEGHKLFSDRLDTLTYYRFGAYQLQIELLRALFPDGEDHPPRLKDKAAQASALNDLACVYSSCGQPRRAVPLFEAQNSLQDKPRDKGNLAVGLGNLAHGQLVLGELAAAEGNLRRSVELCRDINDELREAVGHLELGRLLAYRGAFEESEQELRAALESFAKLRQTQFQCVSRSFSALRALLMGRSKAAFDAARKARSLADEVARTRYPVEPDFVRAEWLLGWALVALAQDERHHADDHLREAEEHLTEALSRCRRINLVEVEPDILLAWARWHRARGNASQALKHAEEALSIADRCEYRLKQAEIHNFLARLALDAGDSKQAHVHAETARERALCDGPPHYYKPAYEEAERLLKEAQ